MFTGIIQDIGTVEDIVQNTSSMKLAIKTKLNLEHLKIGASIACNGCCLTIIENHKNIFYVDIGPKTLQLTRFSKVKIGDKINLEPALRMGDAMGGHQVSGHLDGLFKIHSFEKSAENFWKLTLIFPNSLTNFLILKGSIAILGISLTIANKYSLPNNNICAEFMIIPHTYSNTILQDILAITDEVEVEFDQSVKTIASLFEGMIFNYSQMIK